VAHGGVDTCHRYSGSVILEDGGKRCGGSFIQVCIYGPAGFNPLPLQGCLTNGKGAYSIGTLPRCDPGSGGGGFQHEAAAGIMWEGSYVFGAAAAGYSSSGFGGGATCWYTGVGEDHVARCEGGAGLSLYPPGVDEPVEPRCDGCGGGSSSTGAPPPPPASSNVPRPVNVISGNVWFDQTDASIPGLLGGLALTRSYNSILAYRNVAGVFGRGWTHSFEQKLLFQANDLIKLRSANGSPIWFSDFDEDSTFNAMLPRTETSWMVKSGASYVRHFRAGGTESYDASGRITSATDASGNATTYTYDSAGRLSTVADAGGRSISFTHDGSGRILTASGPGGLIATYGYDAAGSLRAVSYSDGSGYVFSYDSSGQLLSIMDATDRVLETHTYDNAGRGITSSLADGVERYLIYYEGLQTLVVDANGNATEYEWTNLQGITPRVTKISGGCASCGGSGGGRARQWQYDDAGRVLSYTDGDGNTTNYTYDAAGNLASETDPLGNVTSYTHDTQGRVLTVTRPGGGLTTYTQGPAGPLTITEKVTTTQNRTTTMTYTAQGKLQTATDPRGKLTTFGYNSSGDLTSVTDPLTHATTFGYDAQGQRTTTTDALNHTTTTDYDVRGRVTRITNHDGTHTDFAYDAGGRRTTVTDPLGRSTSYNYDPYGRLESVVDAIGGVTRYSYDPMSNLTGLTDAKGQTTSFAYDTFNRVASVTYPGGAAESFTYDEAGRLATKVDRKTVTTTYAYDAAGRLTGKSYSDGTMPAVAYAYDASGRLATAANGTDTLTWSYDLAGQLLSEQSSKNASTVAYTYDDGGNRLSVGLNGQVFVTYAYDDASRLTTIMRGANVFGFGYDNANRRTSMQYPNGITTNYTYDNLNRLTRMKADLGATPITDFQYLYDAAGNRTRKQQLDYTEDYSYDPLYRLTGVERSAGLTGIWHYGYDPVGNRTTAQTNNSVSTSAFNEKNQLTSSSGGGTLKVRGTLNEPGTAKVNGSPARMLAGNVFEGTIQATTGTNTFAVEATDVTGNVIAKNYQVSVTATGASYTYDSNGNLSTKTEGSDVWGYEWNAENQLTRVTKNSVEQARFSYDPLERRVGKVAGVTTTSYTYDRDSLLREVRGGTTLKYIHHRYGLDNPLAQEDASGALTYFHADALGSIAKHTSQAGTVVHEYRYDAWGNIELGATETGPAYTAREWDSETSLYYYRARYYDSRAGRFISEDPIGLQGGLNYYAYVDNTPTNLVDPFGLAAGDKYSLPCEALERVACARSCGKRGVKWCTVHFTLVVNYRSTPGQPEKTGYTWDKKIDCRCNDEKPKPPITLVPSGTTSVCPVIIINPCLIAPLLCCEGKFTGVGCTGNGGA
jgi:RHS repeat-associated protein